MKISDNKEQIFPVSLIQRQFWLINQLFPQNSAYNIHSIFQIRGKLDIPALEQSINEIVQRHEIFRTTFENIDGELVQKISDAEPCHIPIEDLKKLPLPEYKNNIFDDIIPDALAPFDLSKIPLLRIKLYLLHGESYLLAIIAHHIIFDLHTKDQFANELMLIYNSYIKGEKIQLKNPNFQYKDFASWQWDFLKSDKHKKMIAYWENLLKEKNCFLNLPTDKPRPPVRTLNGRDIALEFSSNFQEKLRKFSHEKKMNIFLILLAGYAVLLHRYSGQRDIIIGVPLTNRRLETHKEIMGCFVNILPIYIDFAGNPTFEEILKKVRIAMLEAHRNQEVPYESIVEALSSKRNVSYNPLFQVGFTFEHPMSLTLENLEIEPIIIPGQGSQLDIFFRFWESNKQLNGLIEYNNDMFNESAIFRLAGSFIVLLSSAMENQGTSVSELAILSELDRNKILNEWNSTKVNYQSKICIHHLFEKQVEKTPDNIALVFNEEGLSYHELNHRANILASYLISHGVGPDVIVGISMVRSIELVVSLLAILKAGGAYLPLEPTLPDKRLGLMAEDSKIAILLTQEEYLSRLSEIKELKNIKIIPYSKGIEHSINNIENSTSDITHDNLAYVIYTSGSTGKPKGVGITHGGIYNRLMWMQAKYKLTSNDRILQKTPFNFDVSVWEFFWPLFTGACLVAALPEGHKDNSYLIDVIKKEKITVIHFVPSMLNEFIAEKEVEECTTLRDVICSGEALPYGVQQKFFERMAARLHNLYGPTEASIDVTSWQCKKGKDSQIVPIGKPISNTRAYILDSLMNPVPVGVIGELYIGGAGLARGYLNDKKLTEEKFIPDPFSETKGSRIYRTGDLARWLPDGNIDFIGREDSQVQLRGHRVELGEIEYELDHHPYVQKSAVIIREDHPENKQMTAYIIATEKSGELSNELKNYLIDRMPNYMVPSSFIFLDFFRLTANGKLDRKSLPAPDLSGNQPGLDFAAPVNEIQKKISSAWYDVLGIDNIDINMNFFDIGGNSLLMIQLRRKLSENLGYDLTIVDIFQHPTIRSISEYLKNQKKNSPLSSNIQERIKKQKNAMKRSKKLLEMRRKNN